MTETRRRIENFGLILFTLVALLDHDVCWLCGYGALLIAIEPPRWRLADAVTLLRAVILGSALVIAQSTTNSLWAAAGLTLSLALDGVDGWLARRAGDADPRGARLDVRFDAWTIAAVGVALYLLERIPVWALLPGALRPMLQLLPSPPSLGETPRRVPWGRWVFATFVAALIAAGITDAPWFFWVIAAATSAIVVSLLSDLLIIVPPMWQRPATRSLMVAFGAWFVAHSTLFLPGYFLRGAKKHLMPLVPLRFSNGMTPTWTWADLCWYLHDLFIGRTYNDPFRLNVELAIAFGLVLLLPQKRVLRGAMTMVWCGAMLVMSYDSLIRRISGRNPAWQFDLNLLPSGIHFLKAAYGTGVVWAVGSAAILALLGAVWAISRATRWFALQMAPVPQRRRAHWAALGVASALGAFACSNEPPPMMPTVYSTTGQIVANLRENARISKDLKPDENLARHAAEEPRWEFEQPPAERPDLLLFLIESYGRLAWHPRHREHWMAQLDRFERGWREQGWSIHSTWSEAPVCGGGSWLSATSLLIMYPIHEPLTYEAALRGKSRPLVESFSLLHYLSEAGYHNVTLQPANTLTPKLPSWGTHVQVDRPDLPYDGPPFGFAHVPDQYALRHTHRAHPPRAEQPYALFFETGSSHAPWVLPPLLPSDHPEDGAAYRNPTTTRSLELPDSAHAWIQTLAYTFSVIDDYLTCCARPGTVAVILGDHQPPGLGACEEGDHAVPVHFVTRTKFASDATEKWQPGLQLTGDDPPSLRQHEVGPVILRRLGATAIRKQAVPEANRVHIP